VREKEIAIMVSNLDCATKPREKQQGFKVETVTHHDDYPTRKGKTKEKKEKKKLQRPTSNNNRTSCPFLS